MLPSFIKSFLWGSEEERYSPVNDEVQVITEQTDDWILVTEQGAVLCTVY